MLTLKLGLGDARPQQKATILDWQQQCEELVDTYLANQLDGQQPICHGEGDDGYFSIDVIDLYGASLLVHIQ